jgi:hypothetical protein
MWLGLPKENLRSSFLHSWKLHGVMEKSFLEMATQLNLTRHVLMN